MDKRRPITRVQDFMRLITTFGKVERSYYIPGTERKENDLEHTCSLALMVWYIVSSNGLDLDQEKILKYALAHDLVEVHAGDTYVYSTDTEHLAGKADREVVAADRIKEEFPEFAELHPYMIGYMEREDPESRFVYALDKVLPLLLIHADGGRSWREHAVTLQMLVANKTPKVALSPEIRPYFDELVAILQLGEKEIFG